MKDIERLAETIFKTIDFKFKGKITLADKEGVYVNFDGQNAVIGGESETVFCRGCFLLAREINKGRQKFTIQQKAAFEKCGVMLDVSRNAVMKPSVVKEYINKTAALGMNMLMLYTEDTYEIKEYPYFGYMRGRYSIAELHEIDEYAKSMGVELIPCIQTLSHLSQYLKYNVTAEYRDTGDTLLVGEDKTYEFIDAAIKSVRSAFTSNRIHIGMDEAQNIGLGSYLAKHEYTPQDKLMTEHLKKVKGICEKYGFEPMMWSDMPFKLFSAGKEYYNADAAIPTEIFSDIELVYWDYYSHSEDKYSNMIKAHKKLRQDAIFAGGLGSWYGFLPWFDNVWQTSNAALNACKKENVKTVFTTVWGDDGNETNAAYGLPLLPIFSEYCYGGGTEEEIAEASELLTKIPFALTKVLNSVECIEDTEFRVKEWIYSDILYDYGKSAEKCVRLPEIYRNKKEILSKYAQKDDYFKYAEKIFAICEIKSRMRTELRAKYKNGDTDYLKITAEDTIPKLIGIYEELYELHRRQWEKTYKPFGWEILSYRYGGVIMRMKEAKEKLLSYIRKDTENIPELDADTLNVNSTTAAVRTLSPSLMI